MEQQISEAVNLLWTGGWDSTFRLLQLLLLQQRVVQPHYIIGNRPSAFMEIRAMRNIKERLFAEHAQTKSFLLPTRFKDIFDIRPNQELTEKFERMRKDKSLGIQYECLARYCSEIGIKEMELPIHRDDKAHLVLESFVVQAGAEKYAYCRLDDAFRGSDEYVLFQFFRFPVFNWTKIDMQNEARTKGFEELMNLSWFCHNPRANSRPCGVCLPCIFTIEEGLGRRIPLTSRIRYYCRIQTLRKHLARKCSPLYTLLRNMKRRVFKHEP